MLGNLSYTNAIYPVDINSDGHMDVLAAASDIVLFENNGSESFTKYTIEEEFKSSSIYAADFDDDGDLDILSGGTNNGRVTAWWENQNSGNFQKHILERDNVTSAIFAVDLDNDNDVDLEEPLRCAKCR